MFSRGGDAALPPDGSTYGRQHPVLDDRIGGSGDGRILRPIDLRRQVAECDLNHSSGKGNGVEPNEGLILAMSHRFPIGR